MNKLVFLLVLVRPIWAQTTPSDQKAGQMSAIIARVKEAKARVAAAKALAQTTPQESAAKQHALTLAQSQLSRAISSDLLPYLQVAPQVPLQSFLSQIEEARIDKQVGSANGSSGSTSLVSKGSVPALLGMAVENGALTRSVSGTAISFTVRPTGVIKALMKRGYLRSGPVEYVREENALKPSPSETWYRLLNRASASVSFDANRGNSPGTFTASQQQISGYSFRYDIVNHRDPRDPIYFKKWVDLANTSQTQFATALTQLSAAMVATDAYKTWITQAELAIENAADSDVESAVLEQVGKFERNVLALPTLQSQLKNAIDAGNQFAKGRIALIERATKSPILEFEYSAARQSMAGSSTSTSTPATATTAIPDLGTFKLIVAGHFLGTSEITANLSGTIFTSIPKTLSVGRVRDFQAGAQTDIPLPEISDSLGKPTLTLSGLFLSLLEEPLGAAVSVNGQNVSRKGNIGFAQAKIEFKAKGTGVKVPLSVTYASRTELIKEKDVRASFGVTFDLDNLLAKP